MSAAPIRVAVVGVGDFGRNHVRVWREIEGAELAGVLDVNAERAQKVAAEFGTRVLRDFDALRAEGVNAVSLAVPTAEHARIGRRLLESGNGGLIALGRRAFVKTEARGRNQPACGLKEAASRMAHSAVGLVGFGKITHVEQSDRMLSGRPAEKHVGIIRIGAHRPTKN